MAPRVGPEFVRKAPIVQALSLAIARVTPKRIPEIVGCGETPAPRRRGESRKTLQVENPGNPDVIGQLE